LNSPELLLLSIRELKRWFEVQADNVLVSTLYSSIQPVLEGLIDLKLEHLSLTRSASTLSGGEGQRLRLASYLSGNLTGITYILDEPTLGLHTQDVALLLARIRHLQQMGNTVVVVEHDAQVMRFADHLIELGPGAGVHGGQIVAQGDLDALLNTTASVTAPYLKTKRLPSPMPRAIRHKAFGLSKVNKHNLRDRDFDFPADSLTAITGVSGAGKSTLMHHVLAPTLQAGQALHCKSFYGHGTFDQVMLIEQRLMTGQRHNTVAASIHVLDGLQTLFASTEAAKRMGLKKNAFSYASKEGRCPHCQGLGQVKVSMDFMEDLWLTCDLCEGSRYHADVLAVKFNGVSMGALLQCTVVEVLDFLDTLYSKEAARARETLLNLKRLGLGHVVLGQSTASLSGGEAQRLRLVSCLNHEKGKSVLFLLDEPTSGLHYQDIDRLIEVFNSLVDAGHTVIFIEHNPYLIAAANYVIEM
jgi:excinuclease ABC subunit A